jgi:hypothetical protein
MPNTANNVKGPGPNAEDGEREHIFRTRPDREVIGSLKARIRWGADAIEGIDAKVYYLKSDSTWTLDVFLPARAYKALQAIGAVGMAFRNIDLDPATMDLTASVCNSSWDGLRTASIAKNSWALSVSLADAPDALRRLEGILKSRKCSKLVIFNRKGEFIASVHDMDCAKEVEITGGPVEKADNVRKVHILGGPEELEQFGVESLERS